jgi:hypothetical protein
MKKRVEGKGWWEVEEGWRTGFSSALGKGCEREGAMNGGREGLESWLQKKLASVVRLVCSSYFLVVAQRLPPPPETSSPSPHLVPVGRLRSFLLPLTLFPFGQTLPEINEPVVAIKASPGVVWVRNVKRSQSV